MVVATLAVPLQLVAAADEPRGVSPPVLPSTEALEQLAELRDDPTLGAAVAGVEKIITELEQADKDTYPQDIPDPFHLTSQYLLTMRAGGNTADRYHLAGTEGGLPRITPQPNMVKPVIYDGKLAFRYKHGVHVVESVAPVVLAYDDELLVVITHSGDIYAVDMVFVRRELFKAPLPVHKVALTVESQDLRGLQLSYVTRGLNPIIYELGDAGELLPVSAARRFTAGDLVLWRSVGADKDKTQVLVGVLGRDTIVKTINNGNYLLGSLAQALRKDRPAQLDKVLAAEKELLGHNLPSDKLERYRDTASPQAERVLQNMDVQRLQKMVANDVQRNTYRDQFTYATWQRDYLIIRDQAAAVISKLEKKTFRDAVSQKKLDTLRRQLRKGDFASSWIMLSKLYTEESKDLVIDRINSLKELRTPAANAKIAVLENILREHDYERLWREPQLFADFDEQGQLLSPLRAKINRAVYKHFDGDSLRGFASTALGLGVLGTAGIGAAWALKAGFGLSRIWPPNPFKVRDLPPRMELGHRLDNYPYAKVRKGYRRFLTGGLVLGLALIPAVALVAHMAARGSGHDWDFRKQLTLMGMRIYAAIALPFWHYMAKWLGQTTLMPAMAAGVSPFAVVSGRSSIGADVGLSPSEAVRVGFQIPYVQGEDADALRRRAIVALQQQRARSQSLGWEMASHILLRDYLQRQGSVSEIKLPLSEEDYQAFLAHIERSTFKNTWKKLAVGLEREIYRLHTQGIFADLREVTYEYVYDFLHKTKPQLLKISHYDGVGYNLAAKVSGAAEFVGKQLATVSTDNVNFLQLADPDDFLASMNWQVFMVDFLVCVLWEGTWGGRSLVFDKQVTSPSHGGIGNLAATNRFPYWSQEHANDLVGQVWAHQVSGQGRYALIFQLMQKIEEDDYRPMEELIVAGDERTEGFWAGLWDFGKNSVDVKNTDYGGRYIKQLVVMLTMAQLALFWSFIGRSLIAKVPPGRVLPQFLFNFSWSTWAFAWPWIVLYSTEQLRDKKSGVRNELFMQGKVQLKQALKFTDDAELQEGYASIVAVYRDFIKEPPAALVKEVRKVERDLRINSEARLPAAALLPYLGLLVQMQNSSSVVDKRDIYRRIVTYIESPQEEYVVSREEAEQLLQFMLAEPPFPTVLNPTVGFLATGTVAILTTLWGSKFFRSTYGENVSTVKGVLPWLALGGGMYTLVWLLGSKDNARKIIDFVYEDVLGYPESRAEEY